MSDVLFTSHAKATGGREGHVKSDDGLIDLDLVQPGSKKDSVGSNPEQLFAAGYSACFDGAFNHVARAERKRVETETSVDVSLVKDGDGFKIAAAITVDVKGVSQEEAEDLLEKTHQFCPYSKATRGNIDVDLKVNVLE